MKSELDRFTGTLEYHASSFGHIQLTDGVDYLREKAKCSWLIDIIESYNDCHRIIKNMPFQLWELSVNENRTAFVFCRDGNKKSPIITQKVAYTDFPLDRIKLYCIDKVVMLPSEY
ncbi:MAG: hypothetical protein PHS34_08120 [Candidatus Omnitrophica bacterium]|nr:hypothetical protein [Candidatus Nanoarchaeia archaeon]MDD5551209.1 hypothetical protein [Candidatus Omnitrophota bacterium]